MELTQIRYFLEVAESQHITQSARKLHIAQPALTQAIHRLQNDLGVPLFMQSGRNIVLTQYGIFLRDRLKPIIAQLDRIPEELAAMTEQQSQTIRLNVLAASSFITEAVIAYKKEHPELHFQMLQNPQEQLYDISVTTKMFYQLPEEASKHEFVCTEKIFLAVPERSRYAQMDSIRLEDVKDEGFICLMGSRPLRWICDKFCAHAGFTPQIIFESDNPSAVRNMIAANMGVGFWPEFTWGKLDSEHVRLLEIEQPMCRRDLIFTCRTGQPGGTVVEDFFAFLKTFTLSHQTIKI